MAKTSAPPRKHSSLHVRIDTTAKKKVQQTLKRMGLDVSTAVNLFLHRVVDTQSIPFEVRTENGYTPEQEKQIIRETEWALKYGKRYDSVDEMHRDILNKYG